MGTEFKEKIRSISTPRKLGASERKPVTDERDGSKAGEHIVHWDGRQDAVVIAKPIAPSAGAHTPGEE